MSQGFSLGGNTTTIKFGRHEKLLVRPISAGDGSAYGGKDGQDSLLKRRGWEIFFKFFVVDRNGGLRGRGNTHPSYGSFSPAYRFYIPFLVFNHVKPLFSNSSSSARVIYFSEACHRRPDEVLLEPL